MARTMRGSYTKADKSDMLHIVSAWASAQGITLGQVAVDSKSNEITAIPQLLESWSCMERLFRSTQWVASGTLLQKSSAATVTMCCKSKGINSRYRKRSKVRSRRSTQQKPRRQKLAEARRKKSLVVVKKCGTTRSCHSRIRCQRWKEVVWLEVHWACGS